MGFNNIIRRFRRPSLHWSVGSLLLIGIILGVGLILGFDSALHATSTESFCLSCHEMRDNPYAAYQGTKHFNNRTGVRATCPDCHIPHDFIPKMSRKIAASREVWGHITGIIDTPEKYAEHLPDMRQRELARLQANDSAECRHCHDFQHMDTSLQKPMARSFHAVLEKGTRTCVDCHKGIAHPPAQNPTATRDEKL